MRQSKTMIKRNFNPAKASHAILAATQMPPLKHSASVPFNPRQSKVLQWLCDQPEVLQAMFGFYKDKGAIVFDPVTETWQGKDWK